MTEKKDVHTFLAGIAAQAIAARDAGDAATLERLASNPSIQKYINNVVLLGSMTPQGFRHWFRSDFATLEIMAEHYYTAQHNQARVETLESKLDTMQQTLTALLEAASKKQQDAVKAALKDDDAVEEDEDQAADDAETEAETPSEKTNSEEATADDKPAEDDTD